MENNAQLFAFLISGGVALLVGMIATIGVFAIQKNNKNSAYDRQLAELMSSDINDDRPKRNLITRWNTYWGEIFRGMGWAKYSDPNNSAGRDVLLIGGFAALLTGLFLQNFIAGFAIGGIVIYIMSVFFKSKNNKDGDKLNAQLPGFLFALKANVQANETPERAVLKVVDNMPSPLYEDLLIVKNRILANSSFKDALEELSHKTASRDLKFLCACMIQASGTGTNLENQITVIQKVLEDRRKVSDELSKAVRSATPAIWVASVVLPAVFLATLFMDPSAKDFWFVDPLSYAALALVLLLYGGGVFLSKRMVDGIKNL